MAVSARGFTLIEILVVIVILAITATFAVLAITSGGDEKYLKSTSLSVYDKLKSAQLQAQLRPAVLGCLIGETQVGFYIFQLKSGRDLQQGKWFKLTDTPFKEKNWGEHTQVQLLINGKLQPLAETGRKVMPQIVFSMTGDVKPFTLLFSSHHRSPHYKITAQRNGNIVWHEMASP